MAGALALVHRGLVALRTAVLAPLAQDGLHVVVRPDQLGLVGRVSRDGLDLEDVWIADATVTRLSSPLEVGRMLRRLLDPLLDVTGRAAPIGAWRPPAPPAPRAPSGQPPTARWPPRST